MTPTTQTQDSQPSPDSGPNGGDNMAGGEDQLFQDATDESSTEEEEKEKQTPITERPERKGLSHLERKRWGLVKRKTMPSIVPSVLDFAGMDLRYSPSPTKTSPSHGHGQRVYFSFSEPQSGTQTTPKTASSPGTEHVHRNVFFRRPSTAEVLSKTSPPTTGSPPHKSSSSGSRRPSTASSGSRGTPLPDFSSYRISSSGMGRQERRHFGPPRRSFTRACLFSSSSEGRRATWSPTSAYGPFTSYTINERETRKFFFSLAMMAAQNRRTSSGGRRGSRESISGYPRMFAPLVRRKSTVERTVKMASVASFVGLQHRAQVKRKEFKSKEMWHKVRLWIQIVYVLISMHRRHLTSAMNDPASPFCSHTPGVEELLAAAIDKDHYMFFDPANFRANRQRRMSHEVRRILTKPPEERTPDEVHFAMIGLRNIPQLAIFPVRMQRNFAHFGEFLCYEGKRMVLKQGHRAEGYYFILYGNVMVAVKNEETGFATKSVELGRGEAFGELAIVSGGTRNSSVLTTTYTELLCICKSVYEAIFMTGGMKSINDPDQNDFLSSLPFLRGWPLEIMMHKDSQKYVRFMYIQRNGVIMRDSNFNRWLVVVKSGSVTVLKKLVYSKPTVSTRSGLYKDQSCTTAYQTFMTNAKAYARWLSARNITLPPPLQLHDDSQEGTEGEHDEEVTDEEDEFEDTEDEFEDEGDSDGDEEDEKSDDDEGDDTEDEGDEEDEKDGDQGTEIKTDKGKTKKIRPLTCGKGNNNAKSSLPRKAWSAKCPAPLHKLSAVRKRARQKRPKIHFDEDEGEKEDEEEEEARQKKNISAEMRFAGSKRTLLDDLDADYLTSDRAKTEADLKPQFVYVHTLTKGDVFGLAPIVLPDQPSLCLVSNGAECMLIDRRFYMEHCPPELNRRLKTQVSPYPSDIKLQQDLVNRINWDVYKRAVKRQVWEGAPSRVTMTPL